MAAAYLTLSLMDPLDWLHFRQADGFWRDNTFSKRIDKIQAPISGEISYGDSVDSILSWIGDDAFDVSQTCSADDIFTPDQDGDWSKGRPGGQYVCSNGRIGYEEKPLWGPNNHRINADYIHKKRPNRNKRLPTIILDAVRISSKPNHPTARVLPKMMRRWGCQFLSPVHRYDEMTTCPFIQWRRH